MRIILLSIFATFCFSVYSQNTGLDYTDTDSNYILTPHVTGLFPRNDFTIEFWLRNAKTSSPQSLLQKGKCYGAKMSWHFFLRVDNTIDFNFDADGSCNSVNSYTCDSILAWGVCYHIALTYSAAGVKIYYNGQLQSGSYTTGGYCGNLYATTEPLRIGTYMLLNGSLSGFLNGMLDDVRIWNRVLTQNEIQANYMQPLTGNETGLVLYYKLDENIEGPSNVVYNYATSTGSQLNGLTYSVNPLTPVSYNSCYVYTSVSNPECTQLKMYPNPADSKITIETVEADYLSEIFDVELFDISGKRVYSNSAYLPLVIETKEFQKGIYLVKVNNATTLKMSRVVIN